MFASVTDVLFQRLKHLIIWPDRDILRKTLLMDFRKYCLDCTVIINCFEIFIDRLSDLLARAQTYSSYKHHNTVKNLIRITPKRVVSFISNGWEGRVSDICLTENCGLFGKLLPAWGHHLDRSWLWHQRKCRTLLRYSEIAIIYQGKKQLTGIDVEQTWRITNVWIHVERVIGNVRKKYSFLSLCQRIDFLDQKTGEDITTLDKIVTVCCSLNNRCDSVVPTD